jgi:hypothetical protein
MFYSTTDFRLDLLSSYAHGTKRRHRLRQGFAGLKAVPLLTVNPAVARWSARAPQSVLEKAGTADRMVKMNEQLYTEILNRNCRR